MSRVFVIVEPDRAESERQAAMLTRLDPACEVRRFASGAEALEFLGQTEQLPALVLYDQATPDLHAIGFLAELRSRDWHLDLPVAVLAAALSDQQIINCYRLGAVAVIPVPVKPHELRDTVRGFARPTPRTVARRTSAA